MADSRCPFRNGSLSISTQNYPRSKANWTPGSIPSAAQWSIFHNFMHKSHFYRPIFAQDFENVTTARWLKNQNRALQAKTKTNCREKILLRLASAGSEWIWVVLTAVRWTGGRLWWAAGMSPTVRARRIKRRPRFWESTLRRSMRGLKNNYCLGLNPMNNLQACIYKLVNTSTCIFHRIEAWWFYT